MRTDEYWKKRFLDIESASNRYGRQTYAQIEPAFDSAQRQIEKEINAWYGRYAYNNKISIEEARKQLTSKELKELRWDVNEYIKYGRENAIDQSWMKELENASARVHISRLEALKLRTQQAAEVAFGNELDCIDAMARKVYTEDYYHSIFEMQKGFNLGWEIGQIDERKLDKLITKPWAADGKNFSDRIWQQKRQLVDEIHTQLTRSCVLGKAPDDAINAISKKFNVTKNQAGRLVMTEQAYFHSVAQKDAFEELDVEEFEIVATLDSHTSPVCQEMDGQHFPMSQYQPGVTAPPFHVWCRSVTVPYFEDNFTGERAARDAEGNTYYVPGDMTYKEWKKSMVDGQIDGLTNIENNGIIGGREFSEQSEKSFIKNVNGSYNPDDIKKRLAEKYQSGTPRAKAALKKYTDKDSVATWDSETGTYHQGGKVYFNAMELINDPRGIETAYFHELGHIIDLNARGESTRLSMKISRFGDLIRSDVKDYIDKFQRANGTFGAYRKISDEIGYGLSREKAALFNCVSDIFDGVTDGGIAGKYGHSSIPGYWQESGSLERETFAHMFCAQFDSERYALMEKYFPNALKEFESLLEGVI